MTNNKVIEVVTLYEKRLTNFGLEPLRWSESGDMTVEWGALKHALWMCGEIKNILIRDGQTEKVMRWLGFVQGVLWVFRFRTIEQMKIDNKDEIVVKSEVHG